MRISTTYPHFPRSPIMKKLCEVTLDGIQPSGPIHLLQIDYSVAFGAYIKSRPYVGDLASELFRKALGMVSAKDAEEA